MARKFGGILTESFTLGEMTKSVVIGIGLNINQMNFEDDIKNIATSLKKEFGQELERESILSTFLNEFEKIYINKIKGE